MIGDPLILSEKDLIRAKKVIKKLEVDIILIGGSSGTRKSELSYYIQQELNDKKKSSFVISLDDYYLTHFTIRALNRKKLGLDSVGISEIDWEGLKRIYEDFTERKDIHFKRTHRFLEATEYNTIQSSEVDVLLIEGLYANYIRKFYNNNFSVYLEGNPEQTLEFRKMRNKENEEDNFRKKVVQKEFNVVSQLKRYADLILEFQE